MIHSKIFNLILNFFRPRLLEKNSRLDLKISRKIKIPVTHFYDTKKSWYQYNYIRQLRHGQQFITESNQCSLEKINLHPTEMLKLITYALCVLPSPFSPPHSNIKFQYFKFIKKFNITQITKLTSEMDSAPQKSLHLIYQTSL